MSAKRHGTAQYDSLRVNRVQEIHDANAQEAGRLVDQAQGKPVTALTTAP